MSYNWGPFFIIPSQTLKEFSGTVRLREKLDEEMLQKELEALDIAGPVVRISNPWYYREKGADTWIKVGESDNKSENFPVSWDTRKLEDGKYEVLGMMHVLVQKDTTENTIARQNIVEVTIKN